MPENTTPKHREARRASHRRESPRLDPKAPLVFDTRVLGRRPGALHQLQRRALAPAGLNLDLVGVAEGDELALDLQMQSVTEGVLITGTVSARMRGECGRCLQAVDGEFVGEIVELFAYPESTTDETSAEDEVHRILDDLIDLEPVVRDVVVLGLPVAPLCQPDCAGLCSECGARLDDVGPGHAHEQSDPRWAALAKKFAPPPEDGSASPA